MAFPQPLPPLRRGFFINLLHSFGEELLTCFRSVHLAVILLSLLGLGTLIGVIMPQEGMVELVDIQKQYGTNFPFLQTLGFFNVFSSFWFITLQVLFFFNLLIGSFKWLKPATLAAIQKTFIPAHRLILKPEVFSLPIPLYGERERLLDEVRPVLKRYHFRVHTDENGNLYATKGNFSRIGPSVAHIGILLCLIAGFYSCFTGFKALRMAIPGESFLIQEANSFKTNVPLSVWKGHIPDWKIRVKDFQVEFYKDHPETAKQYYSDLEIVSPQGQVLKSQTISVNHPLMFEDVSIYQASYAPTGRFNLLVNGSPKTVEINNQFNQRPISVTPLPDGSTLVMFPFFAQQDPGVTENYGVFFLRRPGEQFAPGKMPENIRLAVGALGSIKGYDITYQRPEMSTGLQIKRAPEVPLMYLSYLIIGLGTVMCFFSQRQLWMAFRESRPGVHELMIYPKTNKARLSFRKELLALSDSLTRRLTPKSQEDPPYAPAG